MVDVTVVLGEKEKTVVIPFESIFLRDGQPNVYIVKDNKSVLTSVELGIRNKIQVEITKGLKQGDQLIVFGHNRLHPDSPVTIYQPDVPTKSAAK
jgi:membrane fusion protein (multidrug efflux system)